MTDNSRFSTSSRKLRPGTLVLIGLFHVVAIYGLSRAFAPGVVQSVERSVIAAFTVTVTSPEDPPEEAEPVPDEGAAGEAGRRAIPKSVTAPPNPVRSDTSMPKASSTGAADSSGAKEQGEGTGAVGSGLGTGSGRGGGGQGGGIATKPVHVSGGIDNARDYPIPPGGRAARRGSEVIVKVTVGVNGRASNCSVYRASPDPEADRITCRLVVERLRFEPARTRTGDPVAAPFYWRQRWF